MNNTVYKYAVSNLQNSWTDRITGIHNYYFILLETK